MERQVSGCLCTNYMIASRLRHSGVPAKPNRAHYLDQHPRDPTLPLYTGHLLKRPHKCNKVDFRNLNKGPDKVADDKYKELRCSAIATCVLGALVNIRYQESSLPC